MIAYRDGSSDLLGCPSSVTTENIVASDKGSVELMGCARTEEGLIVARLRVKTTNTLFGRRETTIDCWCLVWLFVKGSFSFQ